MRNDVTGGGHWLKVLLVGVKVEPQRDLGARVVARYGERAQAQEVQAQSSFYSANDRRLHFGLGASSSVDLAIRWPSGATEEMRAAWRPTSWWWCARAAGSSAGRGSGSRRWTRDLTCRDSTRSGTSCFATESGSALLAGAWLLATAAASAEPKAPARATFAGGCFWSVEAAFDKVKGVLSTTSGFAGGHERNPSYEQVASGRTGHAEVVQVVFDPAKVPYAKLVEAFWKSVDPFDAGGQFCDRGRSYRTAIFYEGEEQKQAALASKESLEKAGPASRGDRHRDRAARDLLPRRGRAPGLLQAPDPPLPGRTAPAAAARRGSGRSGGQSGVRGNRVSGVVASLASNQGIPRSA